jgi:hypothetical protein
MKGIKQKYQDLFFQTEQTVNRKKSGFRAAQHFVSSFQFKTLGLVQLLLRNLNSIPKK